MERVVNKIDDLVLVTRRSYERRRQLEEQGVSDELNYSSKEFSELRAVLEDIAKKLGLLQMSLFKAMVEDKNILIPQIREGVNDLQKLKEFHDCSNAGNWYTLKNGCLFSYVHPSDYFDLEEIAIALIDFSNSIIGEIK